MQQRLVAWGDIGTDHKALIAIEFIAAEHNVIFRAIPEEVVDKELQNKIFLNWKNGGDFEFPKDVPTFEVKADAEILLPEGIKLHKPELLVGAQRQWNKIQELEDNFKVLGEKLHLLELELDGIKEFNQDLWNKTKSLWDEISGQKKEGHLGWSQADELKIRINSVFDGLKAFRRLNKEKNFDESQVLLKLFEKQIGDCEAKLIYPDEWNKIFQTLKDIQKEIKAAPLLFKHQRILFNRLNAGFNDLRNYKKSDQINHLEDRIHGLERVLRGIQTSIERDEKSYDNQFEKMKHYTRGKMSDEDIAAQLTYLKDQAKVKHKKIKSIEKTLRNLDNRLEALKNPPKPKPKPPKKAKVKDNEKDVAEAAETAETAETAEAKNDTPAKGEKPSKATKKGKDSKATAAPKNETANAPSESPVTKTEAAEVPVEVNEPLAAKGSEEVIEPNVPGEKDATSDIVEELKDEVKTEDPVEKQEEVVATEAEAKVEIAAEKPAEKTEAVTENVEAEVQEEVIKEVAAAETEVETNAEATIEAAESVVTEEIKAEEILDDKEDNSKDSQQSKDAKEAKVESSNKPAKSTKKAKAKPRSKVSSKEST